MTALVDNRVFARVASAEPKQEHTELLHG